MPRRVLHVDSPGPGDSVEAMRIPPSVVVMSMITVVPFGLAIRDTVRHPAANQDALDFDGARARARAEAAQQQRWDEAERQAEAQHAAARARALDRLYGAAPASLGHVFDGIRLGARAADFQPATTRQAIQALEDEAGLEVSFDDDSGGLDDIAIDLGDACDVLATKLHAAWGASPTGTWRAPDGQRAHLDVDACTLTFDRTVDATAWLDRTTTAIVPLGELGKPATDLDGRASETAGDEGLDWRGPGLGAGAGPTDLHATLDREKIVELTAEVDADAASIQGVRDRLTALLHVQPNTDQDGILTWKGPIVVALEIDGTHLRLSADVRP